MQYGCKSTRSKGSNFLGRYEERNFYSSKRISHGKGNFLG
jgi:hypothetical protein